MATEHSVVRGLMQPSTHLSADRHMVSVVKLKSGN